MVGDRQVTTSPYLLSTQPLFATYAIGGFDMTWQHFLRAMAVAAMSSAALALASQARAEGNIIPPDEAAALARAHAEELKAAAAASGEGNADDAVKPATPGKAARNSNAKKAKEAAEESKKAVDETSVEETASLPVELPGRSRSALADAPRAGALKPLIVRYASENGVPYELADAVVRLESRYNPGARNGPNVGLTQINVRTAQSLG